jgi:hypothetical protein
MLTRAWFIMSLFGLVVVPGPFCAAADDAASKPALLLRVKSIDDFVADVKYLVTLAGREEQAKQAEGMFRSMVGPNGLEGIDTKRPLGLYGSIDSNLMDSSAVVMVPVADEKAFLGLLGGFNINATKEDDGSYTVAPGLAPISVHFRFAHQYVYATVRDKAWIAKDKLLDPARVFGTGVADTLFVSFRLDQVPDFLKQLIVSQSEMRLAELEEQKNENESPAQRAIRVQTSKEVMRQITSAINEGGELTLRLNVDQKANELLAELTFSGKPKSNLAANIAALGDTQSLFTGLLKPDAALNALVHGTFPESLQKSLGKAIDDGFREAMEKEQDKNKRAQLELIFKALSPSLKAGELDAAVSVRGPTPGKRYAVVGGIKLKEAKAVDEAFRDLTKDVPRAERDKVKLDAETAAGVKIHRLDIQGSFDAEARQRLGDNPLYVAFRSDAAFLAVGDGGLGALKEALATKPARALPLQIEVSMARLAPLIGKQDKADASVAAQQAFSGADANRDKIRLSIEGGKALKVRLALQSAVVKFFSLMDKQSKGE